MSNTTKSTVTKETNNSEGDERVEVSEQTVVNNDQSDAVEQPHKRVTQTTTTTTKVDED